MMKKIILILIISVYSMQIFSQTAKYGEHGKGKFDTYIAKDGSTYNVGDKIKIGTPQGGNKTFSYILEGDGVLTVPTPLTVMANGVEYEILSFRAGGKAQQYRIHARMKSIKIGFPIHVKFESALESGEIIGYGYTSNQALDELKKEKDKLDLGLITQEEFNKKKDELSKYIK